MGFYYENGFNINKAESLIKDHDAQIIGPNRARAAIEEGESAVICVAQNGHFHAAGYCYSVEELDRIFHVKDDKRVKTLLEVPNKAFIEDVTGYTKYLQSKQKKSHLYN